MKLRWMAPTTASAKSTCTTPSLMSKSDTCPSTPRSWYQVSRVRTARLTSTKLSVLPYMPLNASCTTLLGSTLAPTATMSRTTSLGVTLMTSLTPSRVSWASGRHSRNQPVLKTRCTSCRTSLMVYAKLGFVLMACSTMRLSSPSTPTTSTSEMRIRSSGSSLLVVAAVSSPLLLLLVLTSWGGLAACRRLVDSVMLQNGRGILTIFLLMRGADDVPQLPGEDWLVAHFSVSGPQTPLKQMGSLILSIHPFKRDCGSRLKAAWTMLPNNSSSFILL
mmetsp:Transcript_5882/g.12924  ORF Transcript_5882/g.12924 Transcript_5882/m.12924 type:complete len:276 (-) Transcript_5882:141-968(-)